ncbi:hypothetical protein [Sphaerisporangium perillae]|uniref:hypothetical protein n=1 Tax=Sphaerisporangium perillae TaxID=2935860 RepID=UPI002010A5F6|nr:hypothetical protein [Sphaerisporangium perillae]
MDLTANPDVPGAAEAAHLPHHDEEEPPSESTQARYHEGGPVPGSGEPQDHGDDLPELRRYAEALFTHLAADGTVLPPPANLLKAQGHWLAPAIKALLLILSGEDALEPLARAAQLDQTDTALFLCLSLAVSGHGDRIHASWLGTAFGDLSTDRPVTPGQRALWMAAARGAYGPAGKIFVLRKLDAAAVPSTAEPDRWLSALVPGDPPPAAASPAEPVPSPAEPVPSSEAVTSSEVVPFLSEAVPSSSEVVPFLSEAVPSSEVVPSEVVTQALAESPALTALPALAEVPELVRPVQAAARLSRLLERCAEITSTRPAATPRSELPGPWPDTEPLTVLRSLIGSEEPGPLCSLTGHLLEDVQSGSDSHLAAIAFHVAAPVVRAAAEDLVQGTRISPPDEITVPILGHDIILRPEGADEASLAAAEARIRAEGAARLSGRWLAYAPALLPMVAVVLAFTVSELFAVAGLVLGGIAGYLLWRRSVREQAEARRVEAEVAQLRDQAEAAVWALHDYAREAAERAETAAENLTALTRLLRRGPAVAEPRP